MKQSIVSLIGLAALAASSLAAQGAHAAAHWQGSGWWDPGTGRSWSTPADDNGNVFQTWFFVGPYNNIPQNDTMSGNLTGQVHGYNTQHAAATLCSDGGGGYNGAIIITGVLSETEGEGQPNCANNACENNTNQRVNPQGNAGTYYVPNGQGGYTPTYDYGYCLNGLNIFKGGDYVYMY